MKYIENIIEFANDKFEPIESNKKRKIISTKNLYTLIKFVKDNKIDISEFDIDDYFDIVSKSTKISNMVGSLLKTDDYEKLFTNEFFYGLATAYADIHNIELRSEEEISESFYVPEESKKNKDIDSTREYLSTIGQFPIFTSEEEKEEFTKYANASTEEEKSIVANNIANHNLKLVASIASRYVGRGLDFDD